MKASMLIHTVTGLLLASTAFAGEQIHTKMKIALVDGNSDGAVRIELDSDDLGFNLHDLQEGENRSIVDSSGRNILVTREADGFTFDVDGRTIHVPLIHGDHSAVWLSDADDVDVHVVHDTEIMSDMQMDGVMIVSDEPIDAATQQMIKAALEAAGHGSDIRFIDTAGAHAVHGAKVIRKKVELRTENPDE